MDHKELKLDEIGRQLEDIKKQLSACTLLYRQHNMELISLLKKIEENTRRTTMEWNTNYEVNSTSTD